MLITFVFGDWIPLLSRKSYTAAGLLAGLCRILVRCRVEFVSTIGLRLIKTERGYTRGVSILQSRWHKIWNDSHHHEQNQKPRREHEEDEVHSVTNHPENTHSY